MEMGSILDEKSCEREKDTRPNRKIFTDAHRHMQAIFQTANSKIKRCSIPPGGKEIKLQVERLVLPVRLPETNGRTRASPRGRTVLSRAFPEGIWAKIHPQSLARQCLF